MGEYGVEIKRNIQGKEHEYFGPDASLMVELVNTESLKGSEDNKNSRPTMIE
jgi:hypothetical protein